MKPGHSALVAAGIGAAMLFSTSQVGAQSFHAGEMVEASPLAISSRWESCTVLGMTGPDVMVACGPRRTEYVVPAKWVRRGTRSAPAVGVEASAKGAQRQSRPTQAAQQGRTLCPDAPRSLAGRRPQEHGICRIGSRVTDRQGKTGTVIAALDGATCQVCFPDNSSKSYLTWMLRMAGASPSKPLGAAAPVGAYQCSGGAAGNMRITINGKRWNGYHVEKLPDGRVGISSQPNGRPYYMICERR